MDSYIHIYAPILTTSRHAFPTPPAQAHVLAGGAQRRRSNQKPIANGQRPIAKIQHPTPNPQFPTPRWTFTFSAKERDTETGLSYFGSRYYSSDLSIWLSVDPMSDKYPSLSPYTYCADNPVKLVDPNGEEVVNIHEKLMNDAQDEVNNLTKELSQYKKGSKEYRMIDQKLTKVQHDLDRETKNYNAVNQAIDDFKSKMSVEFEEIDNLTYGDDIINVYVSIKNFGGPDIMGQCDINHDGFNLDNSKLGLTGKGVLVNLNGGYPKLGKTLAHEFEHVSYEVNNSASYVNWLNENGHKNEKGYDGHGAGDPSGEKAIEWERRYDSK